MSRTILVQPIFAPDKPRLRRNLDSLASISDYIKRHNLEVDVVIGGWASCDEYFDQIKKLCNKTHFPRLTGLSRFDKNYGKATVVNSLVEKASKILDYDYILTCDSDINFAETESNAIKDMEILAEEIEKVRSLPFGVFGLNQKGDCHHRPKTFQIQTIINDHVISWGEKEINSDNPCDPATHIAGGCLFISRKAWEEVGGYRVMGVYAGDDTYLMKDICEHDYACQLVQTINIYHPSENDEEYKRWKDYAAKRYSGTERKNINGIIDEVNIFWERMNAKNN